MSSNELMKIVILLSTMVPLNNSSDRFAKTTSCPANFFWFDGLPIESIFDGDYRRKRLVIFF